MAQTRSSLFTSQLVMGLILVGLGILFLLDRLEIIEAGQVLRLWRAVLVVLGLMKLFQSRSTPGRFFGSGLCSELRLFHFPYNPGPLLSEVRLSTILHR